MILAEFQHKVAVVCVFLQSKPAVYIDPQVQPPLPKQDMIITPLKSLNRLNKHFKCFSKRVNETKAIVIRLVKRLTAELYATLQGNVL